MGKIGWRGVLGFVLSAALLAWTLWKVPFHEVFEVLGRANLPLLAVAALTATCTFPLRAARWQVILAPVAGRVPFGPAWRSTALGMMVNNVIPARVGELARAFALTREQPHVPLSASVASIGVDRVFDAVVLLGLMFGAMLDPRFPATREIAGQPVANWAGTGTIAVVVLLFALYLLVLLPERIAGIMSALVRPLSPKLDALARTALFAFAQGLGVLRSPARFATVLAWTIAHWLVNALAFYIGFIAVGIEVPYSAALFLQGVIAIGVAVPSSPGFFGVFEVSALVGLHEVWGVPRDLTVSWAIGYHILSFIPITLIGAWYASRLGFSLGQLERATSKDAPPAASPGA